MSQSPTSATKCGRRSRRHLVQHARDVIELSAEGRSWKLGLLDVSAGGVCFGLEDDGPSLEVGSRVESVVLRLEGTEIHGGIVVSHVTQEFGAGTICGAEFLPATDEDRVTLGSLVERLERGC